MGRICEVRSSFYSKEIDSALNKALTELFVFFSNKSLKDDLKDIDLFLSSFNRFVNLLDVLSNNEFIIFNKVQNQIIDDSIINRILSEIPEELKDNFFKMAMNWLEETDNVFDKDINNVNNTVDNVDFNSMLVEEKDSEYNLFSSDNKVWNVKHKFFQENKELQNENGNKPSIET